MTLLLDTHVLLWALREPEKLSKVASQELMAADQVAVSIVSLWEIAIKVSLQKLHLPKPYHEIFPQFILDSGLDVIAIEASHLAQLVALPWHHRDPFDRLLLAQAQAEGLTFVSADSALAAYGVPVLW